jgi:hypothetical protein
MKFTFATAQQTQTGTSSRLLPRSKHEPEQIHVCYRAANANRMKFTFATVQQTRIQNRSCYRAAKRKIFRRKNTLQ